MGLEELGDLQGVVGLAVHPLRQRLYTLQRQPSDLRRHDGSRGILDVSNLLMELGGRRHHRPADGGVVAIEVLRRRVDRQVGPEFERSLVVGGQEGVVHRMRNPVGVGDL